MFKFVLISTLLPCLLYSFVQWTVIISMPTSLLQCFSYSILLCTNSFLLSTFIYVVKFHLISLQFMLILCYIFACILIFTWFLSSIVFWVRQFIEGKYDLKRDSSFVNVLCSPYCFGSWKIIDVNDWKITMLFRSSCTFLLNVGWLSRSYWPEIMTAELTHCHTQRCIPYWLPCSCCNDCYVLARGLSLIRTGRDHHFS